MIIGSWQSWDEDKKNTRHQHWYRNRHRHRNRHWPSALTPGACPAADTGTVTPGASPATVLPPTLGPSRQGHHRRLSRRRHWDRHARGITGDCPVADTGTVTPGASRATGGACHSKTAERLSVTVYRADLMPMANAGL